MKKFFYFAIFTLVFIFAGTTAAYAEADSLIINGINSDGKVLQNTYIDLTNEEFVGAEDYTFISEGNGASWAKIKTQSLSKVFGKDSVKIILAKASEYDNTKPDLTSTVSFGTIASRPIAPHSVDYAMGDANCWVAVNENGNRVNCEASDGGQDYIQVPNSGFALPSTKTKFAVRIGASVEDDVVTPASKVKMFTVTPNRKVTKFFIDYKNEVIKLAAGSVVQFLDPKYLTPEGEFSSLYYSANDEATLPQVITSAKIITVSELITSKHVIKAFSEATAKKPASVPQLIYPLERSELEGDAFYLDSGKGKIALSKEYQVYSETERKWLNSIPKNPLQPSTRIMEVRRKSAAFGRQSPTGLAASQPKKLYMYYELSEHSKVTAVDADVETDKKTEVSEIDITDTDRVGSTVSAKLTHSGAAPSASYTWYRSSSASKTDAVIVGNAKTYVLSKEDEGSFIYLELNPRINTVITASETDFIGPIHVYYKLSYEQNSAANAAPVSEELSNKSTYTVKDAQFEREGYTFYCWNTKADGTGVNMFPKEEHAITGDVKLYAVWANQWDGVTKSYAWYKEGLTTMTITKASELAGFFDILNGSMAKIAQSCFKGKTIVVAVAMDFDGYALPVAVREFKGTFDGGLKPLMNLSMETGENDYGGLFRIVEGGTLRNVVLENVQVYTEGWTGALAGRINNGVIENCTVSGSVEGAASSVCAAGIVEYAYKSKIRNCTNNASVIVSSAQDNVYAGGIACEISYSEISGCVNNGEVKTLSMAQVTYLGGIAAYLKNGSTARDCVNNGSVTSSNGVYSSGAGIIGTLWVDENAPSCSETVSHCINNGSIDIAANDVYAGGIVAEVYDYDGYVQNVKNCTNKGSVTITSDENNANGWGYVPSAGGIVGWFLDGGHTVLTGNVSEGVVAVYGRAGVVLE